MIQPTAIEAWADLLHYPGAGGCERVQRRIQEIADVAPEFAPQLEPLREHAAGHEDSDLEEVFTRTFDSNAERALETGWHLHGENYARGAFMVRMRQLLREFGVDETAELPDHLSHILPVIARADEAMATALARQVVTPALSKIGQGFNDQTNPYYGVVKSLQEYLEASCSEASTEQAR